MSDSSTVAIIGAGLAGSEAALVLAKKGVSVELFEARPFYTSPAHKTDLPAELVCSNSFKSQELPTAHGLLKAELTMLESPLLQIARGCSVPAGSALAVDRELFSNKINEALANQPNITFTRKEISEPPQGYKHCIIAAGPLASEKLTSWLVERFSSEKLHFYDAIAPIIAADSIDRTIAFSASRWEEGEGDYVNCPFTEEEYRIFYNALREADRVSARAFENERFFEACLPVEVAASRSFEALAFGPLRPVGLIDPRTGRRPFAVCQLRKENFSADSYNMVGFQTRLTFPEQKRVFRLIPGLQNAEFDRYGSIHRNTYLDSPKLLNGDLTFKDAPDLSLAGQMCGNEGYTESIATGHLAALFVAAKINGQKPFLPPRETALGSMLNHVTHSESEPFTPTNINFALFPELGAVRKGRIGKKEKKELVCKRALDALACSLRDNSNTCLA
ncbi:MAG: methylenetetrahydrofolate--tRNA-(uracil(54)-C(5))-methyltransferase (FADH(2)-oxidizing) TrmFO [Fibrobacter sp.]|nr:methylenetetrahydrofolate--tRNA-(uracil(54)-C(5))-methyltransferase (FADH(2)-oxidizing) TrmFO [Fibrobacter sp.]